MSRHRLLPALAVAAAVLVAGVAPALAAESLPGPPARPGEEPIGGPRLAGDDVRYRPAPGVGVPPPSMDAASWLLADAVTGEVLAAKGPHERYRPASTLKTLTAVTLMPRLDPESTYKATKADTQADGSQVGLAVGAAYTIDQLWHALLLPSANDAAYALARANGGVEDTVEQMNAKAARLQAYDTVAKGPSGLDYDGQWTSAYDMALIARAALALPEFVEVSSTTRYKFPDVEITDGKRRTHTIYGQNRLLNDGYPGTIAGKTGFTTEAKRTFWVAAERDGRTLIATMFRIDGPTAEAAVSLLNWGFRNADDLLPIGQLVEPLTDEQLAAAAAEGDESAAAELAASPQQAAQPITEAASEPGDEAITPLGRWVLIVVGLIVATLVALRVRAVRRMRRRREARRVARLDHPVDDHAYL